MQNFRKLRAWHLAKDLAVELSRLLLPRACWRIPGFRGQILRAAVSISANITEGCSRRSPHEFRRYLETSLGSLLEVEGYLEIAASSDMLPRDTHLTLMRRVIVLRRMLLSLMHRVEAVAAEQRIT